MDIRLDKGNTNRVRFVLKITLRLFRELNYYSDMYIHTQIFFLKYYKKTEGLNRFKAAASK